MKNHPSKPHRKPSYRLYDRNGTLTNFEQVVQELRGSDVVLFGELHHSAVIHWLQCEMTRDLFGATEGKLVLGAEMFEADNQLILDEYLAGQIKHEHLVGEAKIWTNYEPDYRALVEFAKEHSLRFIATNIPKRYANLVAREGVDALAGLGEEARRTMAPLPITVDFETPGYREMAEIRLQHPMGMKAENFVAAQAVKDATMAHFILQNLREESLFLHYNGDYHSRSYGGIYWYLRHSDPELRVRVIASSESENLEFQETDRGAGDYILVVKKQ